VVGEDAGAEVSEVSRKPRIAYFYRNVPVARDIRVFPAQRRARVNDATDAKKATT
jgi:hypothetical protein